MTQDEHEANEVFFRLQQQCLARWPYDLAIEHAGTRYAIILYNDKRDLYVSTQKDTEHPQWERVYRGNIESMCKLVGSWSSFVQRMDTEQERRKNNLVWLKTECDARLQERP